jgi:hypothetical protein
MKRISCLLASLLAATAVARAQTSPSICPTAPSTLAVDLGTYHGSAWVTDADGRAAFAGVTRFDCSASTAMHAWQSCNFSICDLPDGDYGIHFSRMKPPAEIAFTLVGGMLRLAPTELAVQAGNYGIDATGSRVAVAFDLHGYALPWALEAWPGAAFHGTDTGKRGQAEGGVVTLSLYPATPYAVRFGDRTAVVVMAGFDGIPHLTQATGAAPGHPLRLEGNRLILRTAQLTVTPVAAGATWHAADMPPAPGPRTLVFAAASSIRLSDDQHATSETLSLDDDCRPSLGGGDGAHAFTVAGSTGCSR